MPLSPSLPIEAVRSSSPVSTAAPLVCEEIDALPRLERLQGEWSRLLAQCPAATPFQSPEWLLPWSVHLGGGGLWVIAARRAGRLVGLAPFRIEDRPEGCALVLLGRGVSDYGGFLVAPGAAGEGVADALLERALTPRTWNVCELDQIPPTDPLSTARLPPWCTEDLGQHEACPYVPLPRSLSALKAALPGRVPRIEQSLRRLHREGPVVFDGADRQNLDELLRAFFRLHSSQWRERDLPGVLADTALQDFHRDVAAGMLRQGRLRLLGLRFAGRIEAVIYAFVHGRRLFSYLGGFSPRLAHLSPGTLMIWRLMNSAVEESLEAFDFLRGAEPYKYRWGARDRHNLRRVIRRRA